MEIKKDMTVRVRNQTLSGESFIEGYPKVVEVAANVKNAGFVLCMVIFPGESESVYRWIDTEDQLNVIQM